MADPMQQALDIEAALRAEVGRQRDTLQPLLMNSIGRLMNDAANTIAALRAAPEAEALRVAMTALEQIATTPRNKGARMNAKATLLFLQTQLAARPQGVKDA